MQFKIVLKNRKQNCECTLLYTDSTKVAKKCVETINGAPCCGPNCDHADAHCKAESVKNRK